MTHTADLDGSARFVVDVAQIAHETLDGETVIIHLPTGIYYSLTGAGPALWSRLVAGRSVDDLAREVAESGGDQRAVHELVERLCAEELMAVGGSDRVVTDECLPMPTPYQPPKLSRHGDMQSLLFLDPIHEAADAGWPQAASSEE